MSMENADGMIKVSIFHNLNLNLFPVKKNTRIYCHLKLTSHGITCVQRVCQKAFFDRFSLYLSFLSGVELPHIAYVLIH